MFIVIYFFLKWAVSVVGLFVVTRTISGVTMDDWKAVIIAGLTLVLLNASLKPVLFMLTLPLNIASLGVFTLVINGLIFFLTAKLVKGLHVADFWSAFWAAVIFSIIGIAFKLALGPRFSFRSIFNRGKDDGKKT